MRQRSGEGELFQGVARRIVAADAGPVLELGGASGPLARELAADRVPVVVADLAEHVATAPRPAVRTDAVALGFRSGSFGTVAALWMLYHLPDPALALREAARVLRPGGWFVASAPSRRNDPELASVLPGWGEPLTFDAENAPAQVGRFFEVTDIETWDQPLIHLPARSDVELYLRGRGRSPDDISAAAARVPVPLVLTKRGMIIWARKPSG
jgi:SAM-dependent methyltransferase